MWATTRPKDSDHACREGGCRGAVSSSRRSSRSGRATHDKDTACPSLPNTQQLLHPALPSPPALPRPRRPPACPPRPALAPPAGTAPHSGRQLGAEPWTLSQQLAPGRLAAACGCCPEQQATAGEPGCMHAPQGQGGCMLQGQRCMLQRRRRLKAEEAHVRRQLVAANADEPERPGSEDDAVEPCGHEGAEMGGWGAGRWGGGGAVGWGGGGGARAEVQDQTEEAPVTPWPKRPGPGDAAEPCRHTDG